MEQLEALLSDNILPNVDLNALAGALQVGEAGLAHKAVGNDTAGDASLAAIGFKIASGGYTEFAEQISGGVRPAEFVGKA